MRVTAIALIVALLTSSAHAFAQEGAAWRKVADAIPLGSTVKVQTIEGQRLKGTLMRVDDQQIAIKRSGRIPEPATLVPFDRISNIELDHGGGMGWGKAIGLGVAAGAGAILTILAIALQID